MVREVDVPTRCASRRMLVLIEWRESKLFALTDEPIARFLVVFEVVVSRVERLPTVMPALIRVAIAFHRRNKKVLAIFVVVRRIEKAHLLVRERRDVRAGYLARYRVLRVAFEN